MNSTPQSESRGLAPRVHAVLAYLARNRRRVVGPEELRAAAWHGANRKPKRLAHYIAQARRALGDDGRNPRLIRTVYGVGYQFIGPAGFAWASDQEEPNGCDASPL